MTHRSIFRLVPVFAILLLLTPAKPAAAGQLPVLLHDVAAGEIITASDLGWDQVDDRQIRAGVVTRIDDIVGLSPRRRVRTGQILRIADFSQPKAVAKGDLVSLILRKKGLLLATRGRAMEDGAEGAFIRVQNTDSSRVVEGRISAPGMVEVMTILPAHAIAMN